MGEVTSGLGVVETGVESGTQDETGRVEGRHKEVLGCQTRLRFSLFSSHARDDDEGADDGDDDGDEGGGEGRGGEGERDGEEEGEGGWLDEGFWEIVA